MKAYLSLFVLIGAALACSSGGLGTDLGVAPENVRIEGLPQYVCPTSRPSATHTAQPTDTQPPLYVTGVAMTFTPQPGCILDVGACATFTPAPGFVIDPGGWLPGATSTPRATYTPWPTPTPLVSNQRYFFDDDVYTDNASALKLRLRVGQVQTLDVGDPLRQVVRYQVQVANRGWTPYVLMAPAQIYVAQVDGTPQPWPASADAARAIGLTPEPAARDGYEVNPFSEVSFELAAFTQAGTVEAIAWILDPFANGYDGQIAGGNVAYWVDGAHTDCAGSPQGTFTPPPNLTPDPTRTQTPTPDACTGLACATSLP